MSNDVSLKMDSSIKFVFVSLMQLITGGQANIREILSANKIPCVTKTTNLQNAQIIGSHRGRVGNFGINQN